MPELSRRIRTAVRAARWACPPSWRWVPAVMWAWNLAC